MQYESNDADARESIRGQMLDVIVPALQLLRNAVRGEAPIGEHQLRACIAVARLAPLLFQSGEQATEPGHSPIHPSVSPEQAAEHIAVLLGRNSGERAAQQRALP